jgi:hypothetical protein
VPFSKMDALGEHESQAEIFQDSTIEWWTRTEWSGTGWRTRDQWSRTICWIDIHERYYFSWSLSGRYSWKVLLFMVTFRKHYMLANN